MYNLQIIIQKIKQKIIHISVIFSSQKENVISYDEECESMLLLKEKSIESTFFPKIFLLVKNGCVNFIYPQITVDKYINAQIYSGSDFIITKNGAVWKKYFMPQWTKIIPLDNELIKIKDKKIWIKKPKHIQPIEYGFSLCGVSSVIWAHFLVQYLPKLYLLKEVQSVCGQDLTVIIPPYRDSQIKEIVYSYLNEFKNIKIKVLELNEVANCKVLYHIDNISYLSDHANYINPSDCIIPRYTIELLKNNLISKLVKDVIDVQTDTKLPFRKIYIGRSGYRNMLNNTEIEQHFINQGFEVIHPHLFILKDKIKIFREASIIVGPFSSGFTNIIFCKPNTKVLAFINYQRTFDGYISTFAKHFDVDLMLVTGYDQTNSVHSSYHIPLDKIKSAYKELIS